MLHDTSDPHHEFNLQAYILGIMQRERPLQRGLEMLGRINEMTPDELSNPVGLITKHEWLLRIKRQNDRVDEAIGYLESLFNQ